MSVSQKFWVGAFLVGGLILFAVGLFWIGDRRKLFSESIQLYAEFYNLSGLKNGSKVRVGGVDAGEVLEMHVPPSPQAKFRVKFRVLQQFQPILRSDSVATIQTEGMVGNKLLQVDAGSEQGREVKEGDTIASREPAEIANLLQRASDTIQEVSKTVDEVKVGVGSAVEGFGVLSNQAVQLVSNVDTQVQKLTTTGNKIADDVAVVLEGVREGRGTVGKLLNDDRLYERMRGTVQEAQETLSNVRQTTENMKQIAADFKSTDIVGELAKSAENVRVVSDRVKDATAFLQPSGPDGENLMAGFRQTIQDAGEAMSDFAESTEALKRNWFFRGFFRSRGFFDMDSVSVEDYRNSKFAPDRVRLRKWLYEAELFQTRPDDSEELSEAGKKRLDRELAEFLPYSMSNPIMVEGYAARGSPDEIYLKARERAAVVRTYLIRKFHLSPTYVGMMPMGAVRSSDPDGSYWEGVSLVLFLPKDTKLAGN